MAKCHQDPFHPMAVTAHPECLEERLTDKVHPALVSDMVREDLLAAAAQTGLGFSREAAVQEKPPAISLPTVMAAARLLGRSSLSATSRVHLNHPAISPGLTRGRLTNHVHPNSRATSLGLISRQAISLGHHSLRPINPDPQSSRATSRGRPNSRVTSRGPSRRPVIYRAGPSRRTSPPVVVAEAVARASSNG